MWNCLLIIQFTSEYLVKKFTTFLFFITALVSSSCRNAYQISQLPADSYLIRGRALCRLDTSLKNASVPAYLQVKVEQNDSTMLFLPEGTKTRPLFIPLNSIRTLHLSRHTFDADILTIPFKIRPATEGFPEQLNSSFSAALYLGSRKDSYLFEREVQQGYKRTLIKGVGYGYGCFFGIGAATMNSYVTRSGIDYEYDGLTFDLGFAGIYDAKHFNLGLAIGADMLTDKNRHDWIYQGQPWFGVLFGLNLN